MPVVPPGRAPADSPHVGCSGWNYKSWRGRFYPRELPPSRWLEYYTQVFDTVEVNGTFYRLPEAPTFRAWREQTPPSFVMAVKASRFLTHMKRLRNPGEPLERLLSRAAELGPRLGPVLYQLPPSLRLDLARLEHFLKALPRRVAGVRRRLQHVVEFRDVSWYIDETYQLLDRHGVAVCLHDKAGSALRDASTGGSVYVRFHGTSGRYHGSYYDRALDEWAVRLTDDWRAGRTVYAYFNNDPDAVATENAQRLRALIRKRLGHQPEPARRSS